MIDLRQGDSAELLAAVAADSVDLVCCDPPYGLAFMGKDWDRALPPRTIWAECLRVLKPGAFAFVMCTARQDCLARLIVDLETAGFAVGFTSIYWAYASGFPKAQNLSKVADKRAGVEREVVGTKIGAVGTVGPTPNQLARPGKNDNPEAKSCAKYSPGVKELKGQIPITLPATPEAKALDGAYGGFQPKPALEPVVVVMKPPTHRTWIDQALDNGKGCTWLDDGRIPTGETLSFGSRKIGNGLIYGHCEPTTEGIQSTSGRFPANLAIEDNAVDDGRERVSTGGNQANWTGAIWGGGAFSPESTGLGDTGSFSRYFSLDAWWTARLKDLPPEVQKTFPFLLTPKASASEKNRGLTTERPQKDPSRREGFENPYNRGGVTRRNNHPTVKPLKLMAWLIALGSRPGDLVLDPFVGSGTTAIAAKIMGRRCIGIERDAEFFELATARLNGHRWTDRDLEDVQISPPDVCPGQLSLWGTP